MNWLNGQSVEGRPGVAECGLAEGQNYTSQLMVMIPSFSRVRNPGSPVRRGHRLSLAIAAAKQSAYEIG